MFSWFWAVFVVDDLIMVTRVGIVKIQKLFYRWGVQLESGYAFWLSQIWRQNDFCSLMCHVTSVYVMFDIGQNLIFHLRFWG
jgi:hypothetical protein